jgi:serine/threonine protein kinase
MTATELPHIPDHELLRMIGRGSYGEVWLARSVTGALRAVKIVRRSTFEDERPYQREFEGIQQFEPISRAHDSQVDVLHVGRNEQEGYFFYVMELADDERAGSALDPGTYVPKTLRSELKRAGALTAEECLRIGLALAQALDHLHRHRLVHRDIKPSNIIFVDGTPKLADIGLVASQEATRSFVGTEGYVPPEGPGTPQADLYSLGKVLYEMCTGRDRLDYPQLPADWRHKPDRRLRAELNEVIVKACDQDPKRRYASGEEMAADLKFLRQGCSLQAQHRRMHRWRVVRRLLAGLAGVALLLTVVWLVWSKERPIFEDKFAGRTLDTKKWKVRQTGRPESASPQLRSSSVWQIDGALQLQAAAASTNGDTAGEMLCVESRPSFEKEGDLEIDLETQHSISRGGVLVGLTSGMAPFTLDDPQGLVDGVVLYEANTATDYPSSPDRLHIQLIASAKLALVYSDGQASVKDLSQLKSWHLRFVVRADTSLGYAPSTNVWLAVRNVRATRTRPASGVVGMVLDWGTGRPIKNATVACRTTQQGVTSLSSGYFRLLTAPGELGFEVTATGFDSLVTNHVLVAKDKLSPLVLVLKKLETHLQYGDVVDRIPLTNWDVRGFDVGSNGFSLVAFGPDRRCKLLSIPPATGQVQISADLGEPDGLRSENATSNPEYTGLAWCGQQRMATLSWDGRLVELAGNEPKLLRCFKPADDDFHRLAANRPKTNALCYPRDPAWDGRQLWLVEHDEQIGGGFGLWTFDLQKHELTSHFEIKDQKIESRIDGLAWGERTLWVSTRGGWVHEVDPELSRQGGTLERVPRSEFQGRYSHLAFADGFLWGWDETRRCLCKIKVASR